MMTEEERLLIEEVERELREERKQKIKSKLRWKQRLDKLLKSPIIVTFAISFAVGLIGAALILAFSAKFPFWLVFLTLFVGTALISGPITFDNLYKFNGDQQMLCILLCFLGLLGGLGSILEGFVSPYEKKFSIN